jgi:hypothetical protein
MMSNEMNDEKCIVREAAGDPICGAPATATAEIEIADDSPFTLFIDSARRQRVPLCQRHAAILAIMPGVGGVFSIARS